MSGPSLLVVDDDAGFRAMLSAVLSGRADRVDLAASGEQALALLEVHAPDLIFLDMRMPGIGGLGFLREARARSLAIPVVVLTAFADVEDAVEAMKLGAADYLTKPVDLGALEELLCRLAHPQNTPDRSVHPPLPPGVIFGSALMEQLLGELAAAARSLAPVLLAGESGTGKEVLADLLHRWSGRSSGPFVGINVSALPAGLVESELFGHEKGAFTGATTRRAGYLEKAAGGTLFLDEIGDLPLEAQPKLLRALETGRVRPLGAGEEREVDLRLVSASNRDLEKDVAAGRFRLDLFYRLAVLVIEVPPLRERREEILPLARAFLQEAGGRARSFSKAAAQCLLDYPWPGNVRELGNSVQRAAIMAPGEWVLPEHLPPALRAASAPRQESAEGPRALAEIERQAILAALERRAGNRTQAARDLGISRRTLLYRLKEYGVE